MPLRLTTISTAGNDIEPVSTIISFPEHSTAGNVECVNVMAFSDNLNEPVEFLFLVIFTLITDTSPIYEIDDTRRIVPLASKKVS